MVTDVTFNSTVSLVMTVNVVDARCHVGVTLSRYSQTQCPGQRSPVITVLTAVPPPPPCSGPVASQPVCTRDTRLPDQRRLPGHRHRRQVHWCRSCHSRSGRLRSWYWNSVRQPHHWLRQVTTLVSHTFPTGTFISTCSFRIS